MPPGEHVPLVDLRANLQPIKHEVERAIVGALGNAESGYQPNVLAFEQEFAAFCGSRFAVGVASGSAALYLALRACGVRPGDEVVTVAHTSFSTIEAIMLLGAVPVLVDIDPRTYTLDPEQLKLAIGSRTRAVVPVHAYGHMADMQAITDIARRHGLIVVEDARHAPGAADHGAKAGSLGDAAAFSFNHSRNLAGYGEGGCVTTNSRPIAECVSRLREHGSSGVNNHQEIGLNARLDELQAAALRVKLPHLNEWNQRRRNHAASYMALLGEARRLRFPSIRHGAVHVFDRFIVRVVGRDRVRQALSACGVATEAPNAVPAHRQPASEGMCRVVGNLRVTNACSRQMLSLPIHPELRQSQIAYVAESLVRAEAGLDVVQPAAVGAEAAAVAPLSFGRHSVAGPVPGSQT